ncbi:hypothetical protein QR680_009969 [Steinernema hermaphroditum]|uniref:Tyrosine-protein kinase n=1 Tax=Steinernema hermaphroditum TaxID=289476 RepID=A0AA39IM98_9BILA|nr:hypothetical protein QR680_009969 [Steinernema hermaphroditum]
MASKTKKSRETKLSAEGVSKKLSADGVKKRGTGRDDVNSKVVENLSRERVTMARKLVPVVDPEYFHGFLPPEDLAAVLTEKGDFLVRMSDTAAESGGPQYVISIRVSKDEKTGTDKSLILEEEPTKSIVVQQVGKEWCIETNGKTYKTITDLINHHISTKTALVSEPSKSSMILVRPISKQPWELKAADVETKEELGHGAFGVVAKGVFRRAYGLEYLHLVGIIHRDIAACNSLYDTRKILKISDFGMTYVGSEYKMGTSRKLSVRRMAPESMELDIFVQKSDVFAYGVLVWEIYSNGDTPFPGYNNQQILDMVSTFISTSYLFVHSRFWADNADNDKMAPTTPENIAEVVIRKAWCKNHERRWSMAEFRAFFEREYNTVPLERKKERANKPDIRKKLAELKKKLSKSSRGPAESKTSEDSAETHTAQTEEKEHRERGKTKKKHKRK